MFFYLYLACTAVVAFVFAAIRAVYPAGSVYEVACLAGHPRFAICYVDVHKINNPPRPPISVGDRHITSLSLTNDNVVCVDISIGLEGKACSWRREQGTVYSRQQRRRCGVSLYFRGNFLEGAIPVLITAIFSYPHGTLIS